MSEMIIPLILSGGSGSRLWPVSRESHPKPFMKLPDGVSLLAKTFSRAASLEGVPEILTITNREYYFKSRDEYLEAKKSCPKVADTYLLEPFGRNTAAAIILGALDVTARYGGETLILAMPADHLIEDVDAFRIAVGKASELARQGHLVTFGITPGFPETGFGYIECGEPGAEAGSRMVTRFVEKPSLDKAREYVASGNYLWNSGVFCFAAGRVIREFEMHAPDIHAAAVKCWEATGRNGAMTEIDPDTFSEVPDNSFDYAVLEKSDAVAVVPSDFGWSDIGSWNAVSDLVSPDAAGNRVLGEALLLDVSDTYIQSEGRMVAAIGLDSLLIVDTPDALLVADRRRDQDVKHMVGQLKSMGHECYRLHRTVHRPWGTYTVLEEGRNFKIKRIVVKPGASLSLQMHYHRSEHWIVVSGTASIVNEERTMLVRTNESTYIPSGHRHRLSNPGIKDLVMIEVQSGEYLGEDDIVRFDDEYGRK